MKIHIGFNLYLVFCASLSLATSCSDNSDIETSAFEISNGVIGNTLLTDYEQYINGELVNAITYILDSESDTIIAKDKLTSEYSTIAEYTYDGISGAIEASVSYDQSGVVVSERRFNRNTKGELDEIRNILQNGFESVWYVYIDSRIDSRRSENDQDIQTDSTYTYGEMEELLSIVTKYNPHNIYQTIEFNYDSSLIRTGALLDYESDKLTDETYSYFYNLDGTISTIEKFDDSGILYSSEIFKYEESKNPITNLVNFALTYAP